MTTNFPTSLDSLTNPNPLDKLSAPSHSAQHTNANDAIEALEAKVGVDGSSVATSLDKRVSDLEASGSGTVTDVSVVMANGLGGTVASSTTTPAITLSTTVTGILKGDGTSISAASAGSDYLAAVVSDSPLSGSGTSTSHLTVDLSSREPALGNPATTGFVLSSTDAGVRSWVSNASMTYPGAGIALSTGSAWDTSITNNSANWNTAYGWGNHASAGYLTGVTADSPLSGSGTSASHLTVDLSSKQDADAGLTSLAGLTYASASFVKMTNADTFSLDTNTYLTSLSGALLATGATTGATSQAQTFTNGVIVGANTATLGTLKLFGSTSGNVTIQPQATAGTDIVLTLPNASGTLAKSATSPIALNSTTGVITHVSTAGNKHVPTGGSTGQLLINSGASGTGAWGTVTESSGALANVTTIGMSGQLTSTLATGTAPLVVTSTTPVANLSIGGNAGGLTASTVNSIGVGTIELGHATDTTLARVSAGVVSIEGNNILVSGGALGTPSGGTVTNLTGTASININGTVGATTAADGKFTTLSSSGEYAANGGIQLAEVSLKLDATLSGDEKWSGITIAGTLGATLAVGDLVYLAVADGRWELVDANVSAGYDKQLGIVLVAGNDGDATQILVYGKIRSAAFPAFTVGAPLYMSETAGDITHTQPTTADVAIRIVGFALTAEDMLFNPSNDYIVHV